MPSANRSLHLTEIEYCKTVAYGSIHFSLPGNYYGRARLARRFLDGHEPSQPFGDQSDQIQSETAFGRGAARRGGTQQRLVARRETRASVGYRQGLGSQGQGDFARPGG